MRYDKNGIDIKFPPCRCPRNDCDSIMTLDKEAPDHFKSTGNYRYKCQSDDRHLRWRSLKEIQHYAIQQ